MGTNPLLPPKYIRDMGERGQKAENGKYRYQRARTSHVPHKTEKVQEKIKVIMMKRKERADRVVDKDYAEKLEKEADKCFSQFLS